jgi:hypothetical protein
MNPPISGQYMAVNIYELGDTRARRAPAYACWASCSLGDGKAQATC